MNTIKKGLWVLGCAGALLLGSYCKGRLTGYDLGYTAAQQELADERRTVEVLEGKLMHYLE
ncbi:MAG: hypothetical protein AABW64_02130, partial [Nanoarchaeota archaeon]